MWTPTDRRQLLAAVITVLASASVTGMSSFPAPARAATGLIQVPVRMCALKGTTAVTNPASLGEPNATSVLLRRLQRASDQVWVPGANISLRSPFPASVPASAATFPIIDDPKPPHSAVSALNPAEYGEGVGNLGDILFPTLGPGATPAQVQAAWEELKLAVGECEEDWIHRASQLGVSLTGGLIAVNIRRFVEANGTQSSVLGNTADPNVTFSLPPGTPFPSVLPWCQTPPPNYLTPAGGATALDAFFGVDDLNFVGLSIDARVVAHEFGHALTLFHGNGLDDNGNGVYDALCDPGENVLAPPASLMHPSTSGFTAVITQLQRGTARAIAGITPGSVIDPPFKLTPAPTVTSQTVDDTRDVANPSIDLIGLSLVLDAKHNLATVSYKLFGRLTRHGKRFRRSSYVAFLDLDSDPRTGGQPASLGFRTQFKGAELITRVVVNGRSAKPRVWRFAGARYEAITDRHVRATVNTLAGGEVRFPVSDLVSARFPASVVEKVGRRVRVQAMSSGRGQAVDVLPGENRTIKRDRPKGSAPLFMFHSKFAACTTVPQLAHPGDHVTVKMAGFTGRHEAVDVRLGDKSVARARLDNGRSLSAGFVVPKLTTAGRHLVTVAVAKSALTAECTLRTQA